MSVSESESLISKPRSAAKRLVAPEGYRTVGQVETLLARAMSLGKCPGGVPKLSEISKIMSQHGVVHLEKYNYILPSASRTVSASEADYMDSESQKALSVAYLMKRRSRKNMPIREEVALATFKVFEQLI